MRSIKDPRSVPVEVLRDFARSQTEVASIRVVADAVGIGRSTLNKFILGRTSPQPRIRRLLALWYLERSEFAAEYDVVRTYASALDTLTSLLTTERRTATATRIIAELEAGFAADNIQVPRWLHVLGTVVTSHGGRHQSKPIP